MATLHLLIGTWGAGKTSMLPHLQRLLPECVVFDWDLIIPGLSTASDKDVHKDPTTWNGLKEAWLAIIKAALSGKHDVVLVGPAGPEELQLNDIGASMRCAYLNWPDDVIAERLRARGESANEIAEELSIAATLRASTYDAIRAEGRDPNELALDVAEWVRGG